VDVFGIKGTALNVGANLQIKDLLYGICRQWW